MLPIALQLYSVRTDLEANFKGTLKAVKALGYEGVEFAGLYNNDPAEIKKMLDETGLVAVSAHVPFINMLADAEKVIKDYSAIGCRYVAIPYLTEEYRPGQSKFELVIETAKKMGELAAKHGITLLYHNHEFEFLKIDGKYALDILYDSVDKNILQTEIDTCWVKVAGENPAAYIGKYAGRSPVVHLKDFYMTGRNERMYKLIGIDDNPENAESGSFEFRPLGHGMQDFMPILQAAKEAGTSWVVVEQDQPSMGKTAMECAEMSIQYLKGMK